MNHIGQEVRRRLFVRGTGAAGTCFVVAYTVYKGWVGSPATWDVQYVISTLIVVSLTAVAPSLATWASVRLARSEGAAVGMALVAGLGGAALGYAAFWFFFLRPQAPDIPPGAVVSRCFLPGFSVAAIFGLGRLLALRGGGARGD